MKAIRIAALGVALLAGSTAVAGAQASPQAPTQQGGPGGGRGGFNRTLNGIELTDAQKAKVAEINAKYQPELQAIRDGLGPTSQVVFRPLEGLLMPRPWSKGRVVLIGDTVHATTPHLASGACIGAL